jgi:MFS family permease
MMIAGFGLGIGLGGAVGSTLGWRWAFLVIGGPGMLVAAIAYRLHEPSRGAADRMHVGVAAEPETEVKEAHQPLFTEGFGTFLRDMNKGLRADLTTIWQIPTMRYALIGVSVLLFTITATGTWLPQFYERQLHVGNGQAEGYVALMVILGGVPGILLGGRIADRYATKVRGARVAIPAYCVLIGTTLFGISYLRVPFGPAFVLELIGWFVMTMAIPGLRAGLSDAIPANLRGAGFGAFNLVSVVFGAAAAPLVVSVLSQTFNDNLRTAFLIVTPPVYLGAYILLRARDHLEADAAKIFEAVLRAMQEQQARDAGKVDD